MTLAAPVFKGEFDTVGPFSEILDSYGQCLDISRDYVAANRDVSEEDLDLDLLEDFIRARAELFKVAESSFAALSGIRSEDAAEEAAHQQMTKKVASLLEEMTVVETQLSDFLGDRLEKMRSTINQMKKARPVFKRYGHLGGSKIVPSRINRHG